MFWGSLRKVSDCSLWSNCGPETKAQGCFGNLVFRRTRPLTVRNSGSYNVAYWPIPSSRFYEYTARSETVAKKSLLPLNLHLAVLHDLLPARDFLAQEGAEFLRRAADRIDADGRELPGEVRVLERATDFAIRGEADVNRLAGLAGSVENNPKQTFATVYAVFDLAGVR